ncbi:MOP flippase family protein [Massilia sp. SYSU DXS3249]
MTSKESVVTGVKWTFVSTMGKRAMALLANVIFARLLAPDDFGLVAMAGVVLGFVDLFRDLGTGAALVRQKELRPSLQSSVFWLNLVFGLTMTLLMMALSPVIAALYREPRVQPVIMVMSVSFLLSSIAIVQSGVLVREMRFEALAKIELAASASSYLVGISAALLGQGVWSLVYQVMTYTALSTILIWIVGDWRPQLVFVWAEVRSIMGYSLNLVGYNVFYYFAQNVDNLLIGRYLGTGALGVYDLAFKLMAFPMQAISAVFSKVMLPYYAKAQDDLPRFRRVFLQIASAIAFISFPLMIGLFATREHFVLSVFGADWAQMIPLLAMFAPLAAIRSVLTTTGSIYVATGRADLQLRWGIVSNLIVFVGLAIGLQWGIIGVAAGFTITALLLLYHNFMIPFRLVGLTLPDLLEALRPTALCTGLMLALLTLFDIVFADMIGHPAALGLLICAGIASYTIFTWILNREMLYQFIATAGFKKQPVAISR